MKRAITTISLAVMIAAGSTFANAGIIIAGRSAQPTNTRLTGHGLMPVANCGESTNTGIIIAGAAGIIIAGVAGLDIDSFIETKSNPAPCTQDTGIIIAGSAGIIIAG